MELFGFIFGLLELALLAVFGIALVIGCTLDRNNFASFKWWTVVLGVVALTAWHWSDLSFSGIWGAISSFEFWKPALIYLGLGLVYCLPEFYLAVRRVAKAQAIRWEKFVSSLTNEKVAIDGAQEQRVPRSKVLTLARETSTVEQARNTPVDHRATVPYVALSELEGFLRDLEYTGRLVDFKLSNDFSINPVINRVYLSGCVGAWMMFWPFYLVSLVIGDLLYEIFDRVADLIANLSGRWVKLIFKDTFKI